MKLGPPDYSPPWTGLIHPDLIDGGFLINIWAGKLSSDIMTLPHKFATVSSSSQTVTPPFSRRLCWLTLSVPHLHHRNQEGAIARAYVIVREISSPMQISSSSTEKQKSISIQ